LDLHGLGGIVGPFRMFRNLSSFNNQIVKPKLAKFIELYAQLQEGKFPDLSLKQFAEESEQEIADYLDFSHALRFFHREYDVSTSDVQVLDFGHITRPDNIEVAEVFEMPNANWFIQFSAEYEMTVAVSVPAREAGGWESAGFSIDSGVQGGDVLMSIDLPVHAEFSLIYDPQLRRIESHEVSAIFH
jgi:hypothetical protein